MKKYLTGILMAVALFTMALPQKVSAAGNSIQLEPTGKQVSVKLTLPSASGEKISSLQLRLRISSCQSAEFNFDTAITNKAVVSEARFHQENAGGILNIYIAGTKPLYDGVETLTLGNAVIETSGSSVVSVNQGDVQIVRGTKVEALDEVSAETTIGTDSGGFPVGPGGDSTGTVTPSPTPEPTETVTPSVTPQPTEPTGTPEPTITPPPGPSGTPEDTSRLSAPKAPKLTNQKSGIAVKWQKVSKASGYHVYRKTVNSKWKKIATVKGNNKVTYADKSVKNKNGVRYYYSIQAYNSKTVSAYNKIGKRIVRMTAPSLTKPVSKSSGKALVKWERNKKAAGYQIEYSTSSQFKNSNIAQVKSGKRTSKTLTGLKKGKNYYFRIRSYKKVGETVYRSAWSGKKKAKIK